MLRINSYEKSTIGWGNRGWLEIIYVILLVCKTISLKTNIMNKCNLNSVQVQNYLRFLLASKLLKTKKKSISSKNYVYETTIEGEKYLKAYQNLIGILSRTSQKKTKLHLGK